MSTQGIMLNNGNQKLTSKKILIKNGIITNDDAMFKGDVYVEDSIIAKIGENLSVPEDTQIIDANGHYIIPGGIDPHTHFQFPFMGTISADDFYNGTKAAIAGGTTMIIDFAADKESSLLESFRKWKRWADGKVCCDYSLHVVVSSWSEEVKRDMKILVRDEGVNSFKIFMAYKNTLMLSDSDMLQVLKTCKEIGAIAQVHAENGDIIEENAKKLLEMGITGPEGHLYSRPEEVEAEATHRATVLANQMGCPLYVVHVMSKTAGDIIAKKRREGCIVFGETLAASLGIDGNAVFDTCWGKAASYIMSPPLRTEPDTPSYLMDLLANGDLQVTGSDNCTFTHSQKALGSKDFTKIPNGVNGVEDRMSVVWEKGVFSGKIDPCQFVAITSTNASKIFNIYPQKGRIQIGSDADIVIWNGNKCRTISSNTHHHLIDYNIFEGMVCHGVPEYVIAGGKLVVDNGQINVQGGNGKFVPTPPFSSYVYTKLFQRDKVGIPKSVHRA